MPGEEHSTQGEPDRQTTREVEVVLSSVEEVLSSVEVELSSVEVELSSVEVELSLVEVELSSVVVVDFPRSHCRRGVAPKAPSLLHNLALQSLALGRRMPRHRVERCNISY